MTYSPTQASECFVIPAQAGIQKFLVDSLFQGNDNVLSASGEELLLTRYLSG